MNTHTAPCGHRGRVVIGTYVECSIRCDQPTAAVVKYPANQSHPSSCRGMENGIAEIYGVVGVHVETRAPGYFDVWIDISSSVAHNAVVPSVRELVQRNRPFGTTWQLWVNGAVWSD